ncbi:TolB-like protein [Rhizobium sp. BK313]|uniref:adenylate/guanylate cyclase domain-containing protein n=1 Tax=Rhizobium sp. BK313 TaxID=2587081 RepID=UPI0018035B59|nr:adenylate/guanylate cyclase domain-containing protein [Rhizobium sp. BK313]MBB3452593.1 TolB-like protein [Rhizobium sp. BK313]
MATDIVGYSRLMEANEEQTLAALARLHGTILATEIGSHQGRIVKLIGDGVLSVFDTASEAVSCAMNIQKLLGSEAELTVCQEQIRLRIGINLAEVALIEGDIFGEGVNVTSRLEREASSGGICISDAAYAQVKGTAHSLFKDGGNIRLKNIAKPVHVWHWPQAPVPRASGRPVVAVLPFRNLREADDQPFVADGFTEDIIGGLARFRSLSVIAAASSFAAKDLSEDTTEVARKLGATYLVTGDLRLAGGVIRVTVRLIEAANARLIWSEKYDRCAGDIFDIQDEIVRMLVSSLVGQIHNIDYQESFRKAPDNLAAYEFYLRGLAHLRGYESDDNLKACEMFEAAVHRDNGFALAHAYLALSQIAVHGYAKASPDVLRDCTSLARRAVLLDEAESGSHRVLGLALLYLKDFDGAEGELRRACALNPSDANAAVQLGGLLARRNRIEEGVRWIDEGLRLNPFPPHWYYAVIGNAMYLRGAYEEALAALRRLPNPGKFTWGRIVACLNRAGRSKEAADEARLLLAAHPDFTINEFLRDGVVVETEGQRLQFREGFDQLDLPN